MQRSYFNPFKVYNNSYSYTTGNPTIQPYYTNNIDLNYTLKENLNVRLYSTLNKKVIGDLFFVTGNNTLINTYDNIFDGSSSGIDISYTFQIAKFWEMYSSWNTYYNRIRSNNKLVPDNKGWANYLNLNSVVKLIKNGNIQFSTSYWHYFPRYEDNLYWNNRSNLSASLKFFLLSKRLQINLSVRDILDQDRAQFTSYINGAHQKVNNYFQNRDARISMVYLFGNKKVRGSDKLLKLEEKERIRD